MSRTAQLTHTTITILSKLFLAEVRLRRKWRDFGAAQELAAHCEAEAALAKTDQLLECSDGVDTCLWLSAKVRVMREVIFIIHVLVVLVMVAYIYTS